MPPAGGISAGTAYITILPDLTQVGPQLQRGIQAPATTALGAVGKTATTTFAGAATEAETAGKRIGTALAKGGNDGVGVMRLFQTTLNQAGIATSPLLSKVLGLSDSMNKLKATFPALGGEATAAATKVSASLGGVVSETEAASSSAGKLGTVGSQALGAVGTEAQAAGVAVTTMATTSGEQLSLFGKAGTGAAEDVAKATDAAGGQMTLFGTEAGRAGAVVAESSAGAAAGLGAVGTEAQAAGAGITTMGEEAAVAETGMTAGLAILLVALAAVAAFALSGVKSYLDLTDSVRSFQRVSGATAEQASGMVAAANALGVSTDTLARGVYKLDQTATTTPKKLQDLGVEIVKTNTGAVDSVGTFNNVADAVQKAGQGAGGSAVAYAAFGRAGIALLPILQQGSAGLREFYATAQARGDIFSQAQLDSARQFEINMRELKDGVGALGRQLASLLMPVLSGLVEVLKVVVTVIDSVVHVLDGILGNQWVRMAVEIGALTLALGPLGLALGIVVAAIDLFGAHSRQAAANAAEMKAVAAQSAKELTDLQTSTIGLIDAQKTEADATNNVAKASNTLATATDALSKLKRQGAVDSKAVESALRSEESATHTVETATRSLNDAKTAFNKLAAGPDVKTLATDMRNLETATDSVAKAEDRVTAAKTALDIVLAGATPRDLAVANDAVTKSNIDQQRSVFGLTDAQEKLKDMTDASSPLALAQAQIAVDKATANLAATQRNTRATADDLNLASTTLAAAQAKLAALQAVGTPTAEDLAKANLDVQAAALSVSDTTRAQADAQAALITVQNEGKAGSADLATATSNLKTEQENLTNALQTQTDSQTTLDDLRAASLPGSDQYRAAQLKVSDAVYAVAQAHQAANDAASALRTAQAGDPAFADKLASANEAVAAAQQGIKDAKLADLKATLVLADATDKMQGSLTADAPVIAQLRADFAQIAVQKPELSGLIGQITDLLGGTSGAQGANLANADIQTKLTAIGYTSQQVADTMKAVDNGASRHDILQHWRDLGKGPNGLPLPPGFAGGGWVGGGALGEPVLIVAHVGERVQTASEATGPSGSGSVTIDARTYFNGLVNRETIPDVQAMIESSHRKLLDALRARGAA